MRLQGGDLVGGRRVDILGHAAECQEVLALAPERTEFRERIEKISAAPDPSLAETARATDLLADVSREWIRRFNAEHNTWEKKGELERENYTTHTDAGYEVMVRVGEAMEQMNAFYRQFFGYGLSKGQKVPHISVHVFAKRDDYLKLGSGPPKKWSGGRGTTP